ncbi:MAG: thioesterase family protein [Bacteroidales bacterium]|nr:thioesterase family protein [Bacteroidales bacterium]
MNIGDKYTLTHVVTENETAEVLGSGGLPVYSTPSMICLMELTSYKLAEENGLQTVGTKVNISHLKACKVGTEVRCEAEVLEYEGRRILYKVTVTDAAGLMGEGTHERFAIDPERFMAKLA